MDNKQFGLTDAYTTDDKFKIGPYIRGLSEYTVKCATPMTISIQGDWGTGKTSIMQMVKAQLESDPEKRIKTLWFNTWQYSQFDIGSDLPRSLLMSLSDGLGDSEEAGKVKATLISLGGIMAKFGKAILKDYTGRHIESELNDQFWNSITSVMTGKESFTDPAKALVDLKEQFQAAINKALEKEKKDKLVIFIDDLDRLKPERAVELLEIMKIFLDCNSCVFILAIDYAVVIRGIRAKYGDDFDKSKGRAFFDKIIQVPFSVPVLRYDMRSYVKDCLKDIGQTDIPEAYIEKYEKLIAVSVGKNPRAIKRICNAFMLILIIAMDTVSESEDRKLLLFAILCMQNKFEAAYNAFMTDKGRIDAKLLKALCDGNAETLKDYSSGEYDTEGLQGFFKEFYETMKGIGEHKKSEDISAEAMKYLLDVLSLSATTSSNELALDNERMITTDEFIRRSDGSERVRHLTEALGYRCSSCDVRYNLDGSIDVELAGKVLMTIYVSRDGSSQSYQLNVRKDIIRDKGRVDSIVREIKSIIKTNAVEGFPEYIKVKRTLNTDMVRLLIKYAEDNYANLF